jgi:hypothetical protein
VRVLVLPSFYRIEALRDYRLKNWLEENQKWSRIEIIDVGSLKMKQKLWTAKGNNHHLFLESPDVYKYTQWARCRAFES